MTCIQKHAFIDNKHIANIDPHGIQDVSPNVVWARAMVAFDIANIKYLRKQVGRPQPEATRKHLFHLLLPKRRGGRNSFPWSIKTTYLSLIYRPQKDERLS